MYYCEYCRQNHYFDSNTGKRHQKYQRELVKERQKSTKGGNIGFKSNHVICKYCRKKYINERFLKKHIENSHFLPIDLHRMSLKDSIVYIESKLEECINRGVNGLKLIHGYHKGTRLRDYFRSDKFKTDMKDAGFIINIANIRDLGYTLVGVSK